MWFTLASFVGKRNKKTASQCTIYTTKSHLWGNIISHSNPEVAKF